LKKPVIPDIVSFSGGVSEYIYGREKRNFGDLGPLLAEGIRKRVEEWGPEIVPPVEGIRATVVGASQYTIQVSGNTIYVEPNDVLPQRNIPVIAPALSLDSDELDCPAITGSITEALTRMELKNSETPVALCFRWKRSATFKRLDDFCKSVIRGMKPLLDRGLPLVLVNDSDVGGLIGLHCHEIIGLPNPVVSIDGIVLSEFEYIDIGALLESSGAVPVVIKSLVFPESAVSIQAR
jgi:ethanolamine utilization protein EutA